MRNGLSSKRLCFFEVNLMGPSCGYTRPVVSCQLPTVNCHSYFEL